MAWMEGGEEEATAGALGRRHDRSTAVIIMGSMVGAEGVGGGGGGGEVCMP